MPIVPAPPSGIKNIPTIEEDDCIPDPRYQGQSQSPLYHLDHRTQLPPVDCLLNPCQCKSVCECQCSHLPGSSDQGRFETLVQVAASITVPSTSQQFDDPPSPPTPKPPTVRKSCCASKSAPRTITTRENTGPVRGPDLPPLLSDPENTVSPIPNSSPFTAPTSIPSIKSLVLLVGTGFSCGFECACPGCTEHRVPPSSQDSSNLRSCPDDCPHCVDRLGGIELEPASPWPFFGGAIKAFLNRATNLPPPPKNQSAGIDPTNVTFFPPGLFSLDLGGSSNNGRQEKARSAWGLVEIPKLECCAGACGYPDGGYGCGNSCAGCCVEGDDPSDSSGSGVVS